MSSTISSLGLFLRPFSNPFSTSYRHTSSATGTHNGTQACAKSAHAFPLSSLQSATRAGDAPAEITNPHALRPDRFAQEARCRHERGGRSGSGEFERQRYREADYYEEEDVECGA